MANSKKEEPTAQNPPGTGPADEQQRPKVEINDVTAVTAYANFCRVTGTPEELIIDFGLNAQPYGVPNEPIVVTQRLVVNYYTAKRLLHALSLSLQRHEAAFGVLETDIQKRVIGRHPQAPPPPQAPSA